MGRLLITGDKHGDYKEVERFCLRWNTSKDDLLIVLGDNGVNYYGIDDRRTRRLKDYLSALPISFFMIHGNHDQRPSLKRYAVAPENAHPLLRGACLVEEKYPSLLFAPMYGGFRFHTVSGWKPAFVLGGAYSVDKWFRLQMQAEGHTGYRWFYDEQMSDLERKEASSMIADFKPDIILSHTCPAKYIPYDKFLSQVDQSMVDRTTEDFLDGIEDSIPYRKWYCGHYHTDRQVDNVRFMFHDIIELEVL